MFQILAYILCESEVTFLTSFSVRLIVTEKWNVTGNDSMLFPIGSVSFWTLRILVKPLMSCAL